MPGHGECAVGGYEVHTWMIRPARYDFLACTCVVAAGYPTSIDIPGQ